MASLFDKTEALLKKIKKAGWQQVGEEYSATFNIDDISTSDPEKNFIWRLALEVLGKIYPDNSVRIQAEIISNDSNNALGDVTLIIGRDVKASITGDKSLDMVSFQSRQFSDTFQPPTLMQALEFIRWQESNQWGKDKNGYYICKTPGDGHFIFSNNAENCSNFADAVHLNYPEILGVLNTAGTKGTVKKKLVIIPQEAEKILGDYYGLDARILGLETMLKRT